MAKLEYIDFETDNLYNDGDQVEQDILDYVQRYRPEEYNRIISQDHRWPVFYHLTDMRENILNWYDFAPDADVLEIGGGMGALTGLLCRRVKSVTTVELTARRAQVIYARHADCDNLNILVGNFNHMEFKQKFDYITLIGVLEYAPGFTPGGDPADFLKKVRGLLKPGGKLLIAIENRFGLKYWCGANEDHTGRPYDGINDYPDTDCVRTFSRGELKALLESSGFAYQHFFYPLPDYKLPQVMYSDEWLPRDELAAKIRQYYLDEPAILADEGKLYNDLIKEGVFPQFANSFFVECSDQAQAMSKVCCASFTPDRAPEYKAVTVISNDQTVKKYAALPCGQGHLDTFCDNQQFFTGEDLIPYHRVDNHLEMPFIQGQTLDKTMIDCIHRRDIEQLLHWTGLFYEHVKKSAASFERDGQTFMTYGFLDMTFSNCFVTEEGFCFFDQEWMEENVPAEYLLFRAFLVLYAENPELNDNIPQPDLWLILQISHSRVEEYYERERSFSGKVILEESNSLLFLDRCARKPDAKAFERMAAQRICGTVYFDLGDGYSQEHSQTVRYDASQPFQIRLDVPSNAIRFRFDPIENAFCALRQLDLLSDAGLLPVHVVNGETEDGLCWFGNTDPQIEAELPAAVHWVELSGELLVLQTRTGISLIQNLDRTRAELRQNRTELTELNEKHDTLQSEYNRLTQEYDGLEQEHESLTQERNSLAQELATYQEHYRMAIEQRDELRRQLTEVQNAYNVISNAAAWKITKPLRATLDTVKRVPVMGLSIKGVKCLKDNGVKYTLRKVKEKASRSRQVVELSHHPLFTEEELEQQRRAQFPREIKFSIVVPLYNTPERFLREMIESVQAQTYANWELCMADGSDAEHSDVGKICRAYSRKDKRVRYQKLEKNLGISGNTNACLEMAKGDYIGLFDHDDLLHPAALHEVMKAICDKDADFVYTDENTFHDTPADAFCPHFKPAFAPDTLRANNYICHFTVFKRVLLEKTGLFRPECDGSQDYDMVLRLTEQAKHIVHIPEILYYWRAHPNSVAESVGAKPYVIQAAHKAIEDHLSRVGLEGEVLDSVVPSMYRIRYRIEGEPLVSVLIPSYEHIDDLSRCIESIEEKTTYQNYEIVVVENNSKNAETFAYYETIQKRWKNVRVIVWEREFNYSAINNFGAEYCSGEYLLLLNNDTEVLSPDWIQEMLMFAQREDVGAVGAKLYYPDDTIQHAGLGIGLLTLAGHLHRGFPKQHPGYMGRLIYAQDLSGVTAACVMIRRDVWDAVNGLDESFAVAFNDVDLCMRIRQAGYLIVWTPFAELYHYESKSRGLEDTPEKRKRFEGEVRRFQERWSKELEAGDPYYNPNFTLDREDFSIEPVVRQHEGR